MIPINRVGAASLMLAATMAPVATLAVDFTLTDADVSAIVQEAVRQVHDPAHGLQIAEYTLYQRDHPIRLGASDTLIDAVVVGTPREQLLYQAYLDAFQGHPTDQSAARKFADEVAGTVVFRVFAHAPSAAPEDEHFLDRFGQAHLVLDGGPQLASSSTATFGPSKDFFILNNGRHEIRWLGVVMYRFDVAAPDKKAKTGTLGFEDGAGHHYDYDVDLSKYR